MNLWTPTLGVNTSNFTILSLRDTCSASPASEEEWAARHISTGTVLTSWALEKIMGLLPGGHRPHCCSRTLHIITRSQSPSLDQNVFAFLPTWWICSTLQSPAHQHGLLLAVHVQKELLVTSSLSPLDMAISYFALSAKLSQRGLGWGGGGVGEGHCRYIWMRCEIST